MSVEWKKFLPDGTLAAKGDDGVFVFMRDNIVKGNYYAFVQIDPRVGWYREDEFDFEINEFDALDRLKLVGMIAKTHKIDVVAKFFRDKYQLELPEDILDDIEASRLARRMINGK